MASSASNLGYFALTALASVGFASIAVSRVRLALESYRGGNRLELVRSTIVALVVSAFAVAAGFGAIVRLGRIW